MTMTRQILTPGVPQETTDVTREQLRAQLDALNIPYTTRDTKAELQAKLDAAQQPAPEQTPAPDVPQDIEPAVLAADVATDLETNYPELIKSLMAQIHALEAENAQLRAERDAPATGAPAPARQPVGGMVLTDQGYVVS